MGIDERLKEKCQDIFWHEVTKVQHYWLEVNAMTQPMQVKESQGT